MLSESIWAYDRRISAFVAEKIMGWPTRWTEVTHNRQPMGWKQPWVKTSDIGGWSKCPNFTLSMDSAMRVVERMRALGWNFILTHRLDERRMEAVFHRGQFYQGLGRDGSPAKATILAACEVLGLEVPDHD